MAKRQKKEVNSIGEEEAGSASKSPTATLRPASLSTEGNHQEEEK